MSNQENEQVLIKTIRKFNDLLELTSTTGVKILVNMSRIISIVPSSKSTSKLVFEGWTIEVVDSYNTIVKCIGEPTETINIYKEDL